MLSLSIFLKPNNLLGLFEQTVVKVCAIKNKAGKSLLKKQQHSILSTVLTLHWQSLQTEEDESVALMFIVWWVKYTEEPDCVSIPILHICCVQ